MQPPPILLYMPSTSLCLNLLYITISEIGSIPPNICIRTSTHMHEESVAGQTGFLHESVCAGSQSLIRTIKHLSNHLVIPAYMNTTFVSIQWYGKGNVLIVH